MTLIFQDAFQDSTLFVWPEWSSVFMDAGSGRTDALSSGSGGLHSNAARTLVLPSAIPTIVIGFGYFVSTFGWSDIPIQFNNAGGTNQASIRINGSGFIEFYRGGTKIGTSTGHAAIGASTWHFYEIKLTLTTATTSTVEVRLDGVTVLTITGVATAASTGDVTSLSIQGMGFGSAASYWDDMYICNTSGSVANDFLGDCTVKVLVPTAAGDTTQWTPSTGSNYTTVDEIPANSTDYVSDSTSGHRDLYNITDLTGVIGAVYGVREKIFCQKMDAGLAGLKPVIKENSVVTVDTSASPPSGGYGGVFGSLKTVRPSDSAAWTVTDINNLQIGQEIA